MCSGTCLLHTNQQEHFCDTIEDCADGRDEFDCRKYSHCWHRVKSGILGQTAKFGQLPCLFHSSIIGIKMN